MNTLNSRCLLVSLSIGLPTKGKKDKTITDEVLKAHSASADSGRFVKNLFPDAAVKPVEKQGNAIRKLVNAHSLPWAEGQRMLPCAALLELREQLGKEVSLFNRLADDSAARFDEWIETAKAMHNGMFKREDYPNDAAKFRETFSVEVKFLPVPDESHVLLDMAADEIRMVKESTAKQLIEATADAKRDLIDRVAAPLANMVNRLQDPEGKFKDSLVENIKEMARIIPCLNVTEDATLADVAKELAELGKHSPDVLRANKAVRNQAAEQAKRVLAKLDAQANGVTA